MLSDLFWIGLMLSSENFNSKKRKYKWDWSKGRQYIDKCNFNRERQEYLHHLIYSPNNNDRELFYKILGHNIEWDKYKKYGKQVRHIEAYEDSIKEIANREGWLYYSEDMLLADPLFRNVIGLDRRPHFVSAQKYPEKILLSQSDINEYNFSINAENKEYKKNTVKSIGVQAILLLLVMMFSTIKNEIGIIGMCIFILGIVMSNIHCVWKYRNIKSNGILQFLVVLLTPLVSSSQVMNAYDKCNNLSDCIKGITIFTVFVAFLQVIGLIVYGIYLSKNNN